MSSCFLAQGAGGESPQKKAIWPFLLILGVALAIGIPACWFAWVFSYAFSPGPHPVEQSRLKQEVKGAAFGPEHTATGEFVIIPHNSGLYKIKRILAGRGLIKNDKRFVLTARFFDLTDSLKAGEYYIEYGWTPYQILRDLAAGKVVQRKIVIPEGATIYQVADLLDAAGVVERERFMSLALDPDYIKGLGLEATGLEGYLFPDTYRFAGGLNADFVISLMVKRMLEVLDELGVRQAGNNPEHTKMSFSRHEVLTLASIVEKETASGDERPLIARVFLNRLRRGMRLQTDPTVIYGLQDFDGNLRKKDLETPTPYNTYLIRGLPPGPIGNPGRAAIQAIMHPTVGSYLYFVSKNDGTHYFSKSLIEHNQAVLKYQVRRQYRRRKTNTDLGINRKK